MLIDDLTKNKTEINSQWVIARPMKATGLLGLKMRIHDAWAVLTGKKDAVRFYKQ
jgi:hypothetical protein